MCKELTCKLCGIKLQPFSKTGFCSQSHRLTAKRNADIRDNGDGTYSVPLTRSVFAIVDAADVPLVLNHAWFTSKNHNTYYAVTRISDRRIKMHVLLMGTQPEMEIHHINGHGYDNRRSNLAFVGHGTNMQARRLNANNTSKRRGVRQIKGNRKKSWAAGIGHGGITKHLGYFTTADEAARAYDRAARELYGKFAWLNFPDDYDDDDLTAPSSVTDLID